MRIWVHRYSLVPRRRLSAIVRPGAREGALIRVDEGFADVHPWPELGDAPIDEQLALLAQGRTTPMTAASLRAARLDGEARKRGVSLFDGLTIPESHWPGPHPPPDFDTIKIKDLSDVPPDVRLRIDFNFRLTPVDFAALAPTLPRDRIDFVEDPTPWDETTWRSLRSETGLRLALDRGLAHTPARDSVDVIVFKPALGGEIPSFAGEIVVTSYMDHTVGQFGAALVAAMQGHRVSARCGLFTHVLYEPDAFIDRIQCEGARLLPPHGTGIGFDDLLERLPWKPLT